MKVTQKDSERMAFWDQMRVLPSRTSTAVSAIGESQARALPKLMVWLILFVSVTYIVYIQKLVSSSPACVDSEAFSTSCRLTSSSSATAANISLSSSPLAHNNTALPKGRHAVARPNQGEVGDPRLDLGKGRGPLPAA